MGAGSQHRAGPTFITLPYALERAPPAFEGNDIKYP